MQKKERTNGADTERITISTSNVFIDQLEELADYYMDNKSLTFRTIMREFVTSPELIERFTDYYNTVFKFVKKEGVTTRSIQKTFHLNDRIVKLYKKIVSEIGKDIPKENLVSEFTRAIVRFFHKIKITDKKPKVIGAISKLNSDGYNIKNYQLVEDGLVVMFSIRKIKRDA